MAKGFDQNQQRLQNLSMFGKDLTRRARSKCELCETSGVPLSVHEVAPAAKEPDIERCIFICEECATGIATGKHPQPQRWRCLGNTVWSEVPAIQVAAVRLLRELSTTESWASEILENVFLDEETEAWASTK